MAATSPGLAPVHAAGQLLRTIIERKRTGADERSTPLSLSWVTQSYGPWERKPCVAGLVGSYLGYIQTGPTRTNPFLVPLRGFA